jgi:hypothetical protein
MSLLTTPTLEALYRRACRSEGLEHETITFWDHLLSKIYFAAEYFVITNQNPPSSSESDRLRRVDFSIGKINISTDEFAVIAFVEGKRTKAGAEDYEVVEAQCHQACEAHLMHFKKCLEVYAICVVGPEAQVFHHVRGPPPTFVSMTNGNYLDANGPYANVLHGLFLDMARSVQPPTLMSSSTYNQNLQPLATSSRASTTPTMKQDSKDLYYYSLQEPNVPYYLANDNKFYRLGYVRQGDSYWRERVEYYQASDRKLYPK